MLRPDPLDDGTPDKPEPEFHLPSFIPSKEVLDALLPSWDRRPYQVEVNGEPAWVHPFQPLATPASQLQEQIAREPKRCGLCTGCTAWIPTPCAAWGLEPGVEPTPRDLALDVADDLLTKTPPRSPQRDVILIAAKLMVMGVPVIELRTEPPTLTFTSPGYLRIESGDGKSPKFFAGVTGGGEIELPEVAEVSESRGLDESSRYYDACVASGIARTLIRVELSQWPVNTFKHDFAQRRMAYNKPIEPMVYPEHFLGNEFPATFQDDQIAHIRNTMHLPEARMLDRVSGQIERLEEDSPSTPGPKGDDEDDQGSKPVVIEGNGHPWEYFGRHGGQGLVRQEFPLPSAPVEGASAEPETKPAPEEGVDQSAQLRRELDWLDNWDKR